MSGRTFDPADPDAVGVLAVDELLNAVRDNPEHVLTRLCEELDSLRAEKVKVLTIRNKHRSEAWRADLWYLGPNEERVPDNLRVNLTQYRDQRLELSRRGIDMSILRENHLRTVIARAERLYSCWAALVDNLSPFREEDNGRCRRLAQHIIGKHIELIC